MAWTDTSHSPLCVGIDLGTTRCNLSVLDRHRAPHPVPLGPHQTALPSAVFFPPSTTPDTPPQEIQWHRDDARPSALVGQEAYDRYHQEPSRGAILFKPRMGDASWYLDVDDRLYTAEDLTALLLRDLRRRAEAALGRPPTAAVVTVPAYFPHTSRRSTWGAAQEAGWPIVGLLNEPTAAALAYGHTYQAPALDTPKQSPHPDNTPRPDNECVLVFDLGGGTLDVSLLRIAPHNLQVLASQGDRGLGCQDWDAAMATSIAAEIQRHQGWDPLDRPDAFERLRRLCCSTRERLSDADTLHVSWSSFSYESTWTRERLAALGAPLLAQARDLLDRTLASAALSPAQLDRIILAGGGSRMPVVQEWLSQTYGLPLRMSTDPAQAIATGAALFAWELAHQPPLHQRSDADAFLPGQRLQEIATQPLSLLWLKDHRLALRLLFPPHTPLPATTRLRDLTTQFDGQTTLDLLLTQEDDSTAHPLASLTLGCRIEGLPPRPAGETRLTVQLRYNPQGMLEASAWDNATEQRLACSIVPGEALLQEMETSTPRDIFLLFDTSASMAGRPLLEAKVALRQFVETLEQQPLSPYRVGLISFGDQGVRLWTELQADTLLVRSLATYLSSGGTTPMSEALALAHDHLRAIPARRERLVIVLSDGQPNDRDATSTQAQRLRDLGVRILAVGLGDDVDAAFLQHHVCSTPDDYRNVAEPVGLPATFATLATELQLQGKK